MSRSRPRAARSGVVEHERLRLRSAQRGRFKLAAAWLFYTGCRVGEAIAAKQEHVRLIKEVGLYEWSIANSKTHQSRHVWLPDYLGTLLEESRQLNHPHPTWPVLWDCEGRGFGRREHPAYAISQKTINSALEAARETVGLTVKVTAHVAKHSYCTNWISDYKADEVSLEKLSRQVGTSVAVLRQTYLHMQLDAEDWKHIHDLGRLSATS